VHEQEVYYNLTASGWVRPMKVTKCL